MVITLNGHLASHFLHPVQASRSLITENFRQSFTSRLSRWYGQAATHQPHPVQRAASISGRCVRGGFNVKYGKNCHNPA